MFIICRCGILLSSKTTLCKLEKAFLWVNESEKDEPFQQIQPLSEELSEQSLHWISVPLGLRKVHPGQGLIWKMVYIHFQITICSLKNLQLQKLFLSIYSGLIFFGPSDVLRIQIPFIADIQKDVSSYRQKSGQIHFRLSVLVANIEIEIRSSFLN